MLDSIRLCCPACDHVFHQSVAYVQGQIKAMKEGKAIEVAKQMADKRGPFYDKWLKAMKARGEEMRCSDCLSHHFNDYDFPDNYCSFKLKVVNPSWFACKSISYYEG